MSKILELGADYITKIWPRRLIVIDEEKGLVFGFPMFVHRGTVSMNFGPVDLQAAEIFKIRSGKIPEIEVMGYLLPYNSKTGWEWSLSAAAGAEASAAPFIRPAK